MTKTKHAVMTEQVQQMHREYDVAPDLEEVAALLLKHGASEEEVESPLTHLAYKFTMGLTDEVLEEHGVEPGSPAAVSIIQGIHAAEASEAAWRAIGMAKKKLGTWLQEVAVSSVRH